MRRRRRREVTQHYEPVITLYTCIVCDDFLTLLSKKPNVVIHILQSCDPNLPAVLKQEPTDVKLFINDENESLPVIRKEKENNTYRPVSKTEYPSPKKKSLVVKLSSQDKQVLRSVCLTLGNAELVGENLPWN